MRIAADPAAAGPIVLGFTAAGDFRTATQEARALLLTVSDERVWDPPALDALTVDALEPLIAAAPEFILLGTGASLTPPPRDLVRAVEARGIGIEVMDSRAAARAWGVLRGEGRVIGAALYPLR